MSYVLIDNPDRFIYAITNFILNRFLNSLKLILVSASSLWMVTAPSSVLFLETREKWFTNLLSTYQRSTAVVVNLLSVFRVSEMKSVTTTSEKLRNWPFSISSPTIKWTLQVWCSLAVPISRQNLARVICLTRGSWQRWSKSLMSVMVAKMGSIRYLGPFFFWQGNDHFYILL